MFDSMQDETFPELGVGSVEGCDDQESVCSSNEREIDAFPKAFERELVTPTNLQRTHDEQLSTESCGSVEQTQHGSSSNTNNSTNTKDDKCVASSGVTSITNKTDDKIDEGENLLLREMKTLEERRKSLLDHHWAVPSKDR